MEAGNYTILARLGEGPLGAIYEGAHKQTQERVVVRVLPPTLSKEPNILGRLLALQRALARLEPERSVIVPLRSVTGAGNDRAGDPSIAGIIECGRLADGGLYIVNEFVSGESLATRLRRHAGLPLPNKALRFGRQLSASLAVAHTANIHHLALRPDKILLVQVPGVADSEHMKVLDLGLLTALGRLPRPEDLPTNAIPYLAPEYRGGDGGSSGQADVYSLGVILYEIGSGGLPASARVSAPTGGSLSGSLSGADAQTGLMQMLPSWLQPFAELLDRMLSPAPAERPSMLHVAATLQQLSALAPNASATSLPQSAASAPPSLSTPKMPPLQQPAASGTSLREPAPAAGSEPALGEPLSPAPLPALMPHEANEPKLLSSDVTPVSSAITPRQGLRDAQPPSSSAVTPVPHDTAEEVPAISAAALSSAITPVSRPPAMSEEAVRESPRPVPPKSSGAAQAVAAPVTPKSSGAAQAVAAPVPPKSSGAAQAVAAPVTPKSSGAAQAVAAPTTPKSSGAAPVVAPPAVPKKPPEEKNESILDIPMSEEITLSSEPTRMSPGGEGAAEAAPPSNSNGNDGAELEIQAEYTLNPKRQVEPLEFASTHPSANPLASGATSGGRTAATSVEPGLGGSALLRVGQLVGNFRIVSKIGQGGMGAVYAAVHRQIGRRAAIKVLHSSLSRTADYTARFLNEARAVNILRHPNLVEIFDFGQLPDGTLYIIMEFLEGESLRAKLRRVHKLAEPVAVEMALQMARALESAHQKGIVHRDLKPENVMLVADSVRPEEERIKILDFGIAKMTQQGATNPASTAGLPTDPDSQEFQTAIGTTMGTPKYMAPEQYGDASKVDGKADVFALGVILYELVSGQVPFPKTSLSAFHQAPKQLLEVAPTVSPKLATLIHRMLTPKPAERPSMREVLELLTPPPPALPVPPPPPPVPTSGYWGWVTLVFFVVAAGLTGTAAYKGWLRPPPPPPAKSSDDADLLIDTAGPKARALGVLYQGLRASDAGLRAQAARALGQSRDVAQWSSIASLLKDRDPAVQAEAAEGLGELGASDASPELLAALDTPLPPGVRVAVAGALARLVHPRGTQVLKAMLTDSDERIRLRAALLLLESGDQSAAEPLRTALQKGNLPDDTVVRILGRLAQSGDEKATQQLNARMVGEGFSQRRIFAAGQLARLGDDRARALLTDGAQKPGPQQLISALLLATVGDTASYGLFKNIAVDSRQPIEARQLSMDGLGACGRRQGAVLLAGVLDETTATPRLRQVAAGAILQITGGDPSQIAKQSLSWAQAALGNDDWLKRQEATTVLGDLDSEQSVPLLAKALEDTQREVRRSAATALGQKTVRSALYALRVSLNDAEPEVRQAGLRAMVNLLGTLGAAGSRVTDEQTRARLKELVETGSVEDQVIASATLYRLGDATQLDRLRGALTSPNPLLRKLVVDTVSGDEPLLKQALNDSEPAVRFVAARRLGALGQKEAVPELQKALAAGGADGLIAYGLLRKLGEPVTLPSGVGSLIGKDTPTSLALLDAAADMPAAEALPLLNKLRFDMAPQVRRRVGEVAAALYRKAPDPSLLAVVYSLINDPNVSVRTRLGSLVAGLLRPNAAPKEEPPPDLGGPSPDLASPPPDAGSPPASDRGSLHLSGEQWVRFQLDQQSTQSFGTGPVVLSLAPGRHRIAFAGGAMEVTVAAGASVNAQVPLTYAEQLLGDAAEAILRHDLGRTQQLVNRARLLLERGHGAPGTQGELRLLQARIFDAQGRWEEAMHELQILFKLPAGQRKPEQLAAAQALQSRLGARLGRIRIYKEGDGRCLLSEDWVRPGEHVIDEGGGHARVVRVREGATVEVNLCQGAASP